VWCYFLLEKLRIAHFDLFEVSLHNVLTHTFCSWFSLLKLIVNHLQIFTFFKDLFPDQFVDSFFLRCKTESRQHQKVEVCRPEVVVAIQISKKRWWAQFTCHLSKIDGHL
jgi:hypothetical protein